MAYTLTLAKADRETIAFVGHRYAWSEALGNLYARSAWEGDSDSDAPIMYTMPEHVAWELAEAFEQDTEGGHGYFSDARRALGVGGEVVRANRRDRVNRPAVRRGNSE